jgi:hypothetical protein
VGVRLLGLWTILTAAGSFVGIVAQNNGWLTPSANDPKYWYLYTVVELGLGLFMLLGADLIVRVAYSTPQKPKVEDDESSGEGQVP